MQASENLEARAVAEARIIAGAPQDSEEQASLVCNAQLRGSWSMRCPEFPIQSSDSTRNGAKEAERRRRASPLPRGFKRLIFSSLTVCPAFE